MEFRVLASLWTMLGLAAAARESFNTQPPPVSPDFSCNGRPMGFYADVETNCRGYHMCDDHGNHFAHYCPEDTAFRQDAMICDHAYLVDCRANVESAPPQPRIGQDNNHDAAPSSFAEPRGEGSNSRGYARSFRINPESKGANAAKYPTFELNSSVFLTNREPSTKRGPSTTTRSRESAKTSVTPNHFNDDSFEAHAKNFLSTTARTTISGNPPAPSGSFKNTKVFNNFPDDEFSFLEPPPERDDNVFFPKKTFESLKTDSTRFQKSSIEPFKIDTTNNDFHKPSSPSVIFSPRTEMILEMVKARGLSRADSSATFSLPKPANFLEPPFLKSDSSSFSRSSFNFRNDDFPYVETLRSIQNNKPTNHSFSFLANPTPRTTTPSPTKVRTSTEASIFAAPTKPLLSGDAEQDPYYPKTPTTTEAYFTPRHQTNKNRKPYFTTRKPPASSAKFEIPAVLPDLNSLEDLLDRRKFFFIPRIKSV